MAGLQFQFVLSVHGAFPLRDRWVQVAAPPASWRAGRHCWAVLAGAMLVLGSCAQAPQAPAGFTQARLPLTSTTSFESAHDTSLAQALAAPQGGATTLRMDGDSPTGTGQDVVALLSWQLGGIPPGAQVVAARLIVGVTDASSGTWSAYPVLRAWDETQANWTQAATGQPWQMPGAAGVQDRGSAAVATFVATSTGSKTFALNAAGVALVQQWLDAPTTNFGLVVAGGSSNGLDLASREASTASQRPKLEIDWQTDAIEPPGTEPGVLVAQDAVWRYRDNGQDPGPTWQTLALDDSGWPTGPAPLGYGGGGEATVVGYGSSSSDKYITTWFRRGFQVDNPALWQSIQVSLHRDDGAAIYLNGTEILRSNLPSGTLLPSTLASSTSSDTVAVVATVPTSLLQVGDNLLAVEVHQRSAGSSDIAFDLALSGTKLAGPLCVDGGCDDGKVCTTDTCNPDLGCQHAPSGAPSCADGSACTTGDHCDGASCVGTVVSCDDGNACTTDSCDPIAGCQHAAAACNDSKPCTTDSCSTSLGCLFEPIPGCVSTLPAATLLAQGSVWKYLDNGSNQGTAWRAPGFSDSSWSQGPAMLGYGEDDKATIVSYGSSSGSKYITTYFRSAFTVTDPTTLPPLTLRLWRDDGAVVYLNGTELTRSNMPSGTISYTTLAGPASEGETAYETLVLPSQLLIGKNVFAVEVHQSSKSSSDLSFDLDLRSACPDDEPTETLCDGHDNDCDGVTDLLLPVAANACATAANGACGRGFQVCLDGAVACLTPPPVAEVHNGQDDDCDGTTDEAPSGDGLPVRVRVMLPPSLDKSIADGMVEVLEVLGVPYQAVASSSQIAADWAAAFGELDGFTVAVMPGTVAGANLSATQLSQLQAWVESGGVLVLVKPTSGSVLTLAGATSATARNNVTDVRVEATVPGALYLDSGEERNLKVSKDLTAPSTVFTYGLAAGSGVVAFGTARSAGSGLGPTWLRRPLGTGAVYALGFDALNKTDYRCYTTCFDPGRDVMAMVIRAVVREGTRGHFVRKHSVPGTESTVLLLSHDIDSDDAHNDGAWGEAGAIQMAKIEVKHGVRGTYFITTDPDYYNPSLLGKLCGLGMCPLGGHSMQHLVMANLSLGSCSVTAANYDLTKPTFCGEIVANRELVLKQEPAGTPYLYWRAPYLSVHASHFEVLNQLGFVYDSSLAIGDLRTNFPVMVARFPYKQDVFKGKPLVTFPIAQSDSLRPSNKKQKVTDWTNALLNNLRNGAWNTLLVHPSAGDGLVETFVVKIQAVDEFIGIAKQYDVLIRAMDQAGPFWRARDAVKLTANWSPTLGYAGTFQIGPLTAPDFSLEFGDDLAAFSCPGAGPFTLKGNRVVFEDPLPAGQTFTFTATVP